MKHDLVSTVGNNRITASRVGYSRLFTVAEAEVKAGMTGRRCRGGVGEEAGV